MRTGMRSHTSIYKILFSYDLSAFSADCMQYYRRVWNQMKYKTQYKYWEQISCVSSERNGLLSETDSNDIEREGKNDYSFVTQYLWDLWITNRLLSVFSLIRWHTTITTSADKRVFSVIYLQINKKRVISITKSDDRQTQMPFPSLSLPELKCLGTWLKAGKRQHNKRVYLLLVLSVDK